MLYLVNFTPVLGIDISWCCGPSFSQYHPSLLSCHDQRKYISFCLSDDEWLPIHKPAECWKYFYVHKNDIKAVKCRNCPKLFSNPTCDTAWYHLEHLHSVKRIVIQPYSKSIYTTDASTVSPRRTGSRRFDE